MSNKLKTIIAVVVIAIIGILTGVGVNININHEGEAETTIEATEAKSQIEYAPEAVPASITVGEEAIEGVESGQGSIGEEVQVESVNGYGVPTVESIESNGPVTEINGEEIYQKCLQENEECGQGAVYPQLDISSPQAFTNAVLNKCIDVDGHYGAQCWDLASAFHYQYTGRVLLTCGTGAAKGVIADGCWQRNNLGEYVTTWNYNDIIAGSLVFFGGGQFGHVGIALGPVHNGYITLLGQNQGGGYCPGGGSAANIINISVKDFIGAFIPTIYIPPTPAPAPEPEVNACQVRKVQAGETLGQIMQECRGEIEWGEAMNDYARHWISTETNAGRTVFYGWTHDTGYGLYAGDVIEYEAE